MINNDMSPITSFRGKYDFLSNFYECPVRMSFGKELIITFNNAESAFQAHKSPLCEDLLKFSTMTAKQAKAYGRKVKLREDWDKIKLNVMYNVVTAKFLQNPDLSKRLIDTGNRELIEGNTWRDTFWGVYNGKGENHLGSILMQVRKEIILALSVMMIN